MKTTSELASKFNLELTGSPEVEIVSVAMDSSQVTAGCLFIAVQGAKSHGLDYLDQAVANGAVAVLSDREVAADLPSLRHSDPRAIAGQVAAEVFGTADLGLRVFGVTGTNGKTSTSFYLQQLLQGMGVRTGLSTSASTNFEDHQFESHLTTPEAPRLHWLAAETAKLGAQALVIEVSAQALARHRVDGMHFEVAGFTNLSRDHLDDFGSMDEYLSAKRELFTNKFSDSAVISVEDDFAKQLLEGLEIAGVGIGDGLQYQLQKTDHGLKITGKQNLELNLEIGPLMAKNLALAVIMLLEAGFDARELTSAAEAMEIQVPGRLELVGPGLPHVYVDYAHTPAAIDAAGRELKSKYPELTIVFGASGDRDPGKRSEMAVAAAKYGDILVVTDQHPRSEDPALIRKTLLDAALQQTNSDRIFEVADPAEAIAKAVNITASGGAILWCGPGHLTYREVKGQKLPFDAIAVARKALES